MAEDLKPTDPDTTQFEELYGEANDPAKLQHGFFARLYTGTGAFEFVAKRKMWYFISLGFLVVSILAMAIRGFTFGVDFTGGSKLNMPIGDSEIATEQVVEVYRDAVGREPSSVAIVGSGSGRMVEIQSKHLSNREVSLAKMKLAAAFNPRDINGNTGEAAIGDSTVSNTWGSTVTKKALIALVVFLIVVGLYIAVRFERDMAIVSILALFLDTIITAGIYALIGFEVTPATVIGLLTILAFSLYDTVVVFDKVEENTAAAMRHKRHTYAEGANLAINQTIMRSINTTIISVLPIIALMIVAVWMLGVGTLQDLALIQLVGVVVGTYSSVCLATPLLVDVKERYSAEVKEHDAEIRELRKAVEEPELIEA